MIRVKDLTFDDELSLFQHFRLELNNILKEFEGKELNESTIAQVKDSVIAFFDKYVIPEDTELIELHLAVNERGGLTFSPANEETAKLLQAMISSDEALNQGSKP